MTVDNEGVESIIGQTEIEKNVKSKKRKRRIKTRVDNSIIDWSVLTALMVG